MPAGSPLENLVLVDGTYYAVAEDGKYAPANLNVTPLTRVVPTYTVPAELKELRVVLQFKVSEEGRVLDPIVDVSSNTDFDQAALKAIRHWQFLPKLKNGKPVVATAKLPLSVSK
jgi:TonB family protein